MLSRSIPRTGSLAEFRTHLARLRNFITDEDWYRSLAFDLALDPVLEEWAMARVAAAEACPPSGQEIADLLDSMRRDVVERLRRLPACETPLRRWQAARDAYARYGMMEVMIEASAFSDGVLARLRGRFPQTYLETLARIDRARPSKLTQGERAEDARTEIGKPKRAVPREDADLALLRCPEVRDYLTLKDWQDDQNVFHATTLHPPFCEARREFEGWQNGRLPQLSACKGRNLLALVLIAETPLLPIEWVSRLLLAGVGREMAAVVGGKAYGLARLQAGAFGIPETSVLPVSAAGVPSCSEALSALPPKRWAVRSSATVEDNERQSFAGLFASYLDVPASGLTDAIRRVVESGASARVRAYMERFGTARPEMAVVLQDFLPPTTSGVWLGTGTESGILEWVAGTGEALVSGQVRPHREDWEQVSEGDSPTEGPEDALTAEDAPVGRRCLRIQQAFGTPLDLEWCVREGRLTWLQCRPVTRQAPAAPDGLHGADQGLAPGVLTGVAASAGTAEGSAALMDEPTSGAWTPGAVLVTRSTDPEWVPIMMSAAGIVTREGGALSHTAIIARELGIPCVTGVAAGLEGIRSGQTLRVDGNAGTVTLR